MPLCGELGREKIFFFFFFASVLAYMRVCGCIYVCVNVHVCVCVRVCLYAMYSWNTALEDVFLKVGAEDQAPLRTGVVGEGFVANEGAILGHRPRRQHQASTAINGASSTEALARSLVASGPAEGSDWEGSEETESLCSE